MKYFIVASLITIVGCSVEMKDSCSSTGTTSECQPTQSAPPSPPETSPPEKNPKDPQAPTKPRSGVVKCSASPEAGTGCVWTQVASGGSSLRIGDVSFDDADDFQRYITHMLHEIGENVDSNGDGNYLTFKYPREITNSSFVSKFKATFTGEEIKNAVVYPEQGDIVANKMLPGDYVLRVYASFDLVERTYGSVVVAKCLRLEHKSSPINVNAGEQTLVKPIDTFDLSIHDGSCSDARTSFRDVFLPPKHQVPTPTGTPPYIVTPPPLPSIPPPVNIVPPTP